MLNMAQEAQQILRSHPEFRNWTVENSSTLRCPHGHLIEWDGECPDGCESPLVTLGLI